MIKQSAAQRKKKKAVVWQTYCAFVLQGVEAPLHWRIIVWLSGFAHALGHMGRPAELYKSLWCILASLVTSPEKESGSRRLFFSTIFPEQLRILCAWQEKSPLNQTTGSDGMQFIPPCSFTLSDGTSKSAIMSKRHSGRFAVIWSEAVKALKCWLIWPMQAWLSYPEHWWLFPFCTSDSREGSFLILYLPVSLCEFYCRR